MATYHGPRALCGTPQSLTTGVLQSIPTNLQRRLPAETIPSGLGRFYPLVRQNVPGTGRITTARVPVSMGSSRTWAP